VTEHFFAPCPRGLEAPLAAELDALGASEITTTDGGAAFAGPIQLAYRANLESRLASRILWRVGHGAYRDENDVYELAKALDWPRWFRVDRTLRVDVAASRSPLTSLEFATLRIKDAVCDRHRAVGGVRPSISKDRPDVRVHAYLTATDASFYSTPRASRCSSAATGARPPTLRCARIWRRACCAWPDGSRERRCSIRCAVAEPSPSKPR
jgi:putative N6-adenine-specific DNA methylase